VEGIGGGDRWRGRAGGLVEGAGGVGWKFDASRVSKITSYRRFQIENYLTNMYLLLKPSLVV